MIERRSGEELSGVLSLGLLAEGAVMALGRVIRSEPLRYEDLRVVADARRLFELMATEDVLVVETLEDQMLTDESSLDALRVVELQEGDGLHDRAQRYVELLQKVIDGSIEEKEERSELESLRALFVEVGEATLSRANELSRAYQEPSWRPAYPATSRF